MYDLFSVFESCLAACHIIWKDLFYHRIEAPIPISKISYCPNPCGSLLELLLSLSVFINQSFIWHQFLSMEGNIKMAKSKISNLNLNWLDKKSTYFSLPDQHSLHFLDKIIKLTDKDLNMAHQSWINLWLDKKLTPSKSSPNLFSGPQERYPSQWKHDSASYMEGRCSFN